MSGELWLGEGFTSYYGPLILRRAGLAEREPSSSPKWAAPSTPC